MVGSPDFLTVSEQDQAPVFPELENPEGELHLRFYTPSGHEFALPASGIREVLSAAPDRITPIPNVSPLLLGALNVRGQVIWVADLGQFLGDSSMLDTDRQEIAVIAIEDQDMLLGLAVNQVLGMAWLDLEQLQPPTNVPDSVAPFLKGEYRLPETDQVLRVLDQVAILRSARWAA
jgi:twitching motility protein PilI